MVCLIVLRKELWHHLLTNKRTQEIEINIPYTPSNFHLRALKHPPRTTMRQKSALDYWLYAVLVRRLSTVRSCAGKAVDLVRRLIHGQFLSKAKAKYAGFLWYAARSGRLGVTMASLYEWED